MKIDDIRTLYDYNYWANERILTTCRRLDIEQFLAPSTMAHGGVRDTLVHTLGAEWIWRMRCQEQTSPTALLPVDEFPDLATLAARWREEEDAMRGYLAGLSDNDLIATIQSKSTSGERRTGILWHILIHVVNHGTQHRSEVAAMLTDYGHSPGDIDMIYCFSELGA